MEAIMWLPSLHAAYGGTVQIKDLPKGWAAMSVFKIPNPPEGLGLELKPEIVAPIQSSAPLRSLNDEPGKTDLSFILYDWCCEWKRMLVESHSHGCLGASVSGTSKPAPI